MKKFLSFDSILLFLASTALLAGFAVITFAFVSKNESSSQNTLQQSIVDTPTNDRTEDFPIKEIKVPEKNKKSEEITETKTETNNRPNIVNEKPVQITTEKPIKPNLTCKEKKYTYTPKKQKVLLPKYKPKKKLAKSIHKKRPKKKKRKLRITKSRSTIKKTL